MPSKRQLTGMQGVYLVAAELSRLGYVVSPTSRSARAADLLVTDQACKRAHSVQVKTNSSKSSYWLLGKDAKELRSPSHVYVFVAIQPKVPFVSYFVVASDFVADRTYEERFGDGTWYSFTFEGCGTVRESVASALWPTL